MPNINVYIGLNMENNEKRDNYPHKENPLHRDDVHRHDDKDDNKYRQSLHRHDDKYNFGLMATMIVLGWFINFCFGWERGDPIYGIVMMVCLIVWFVVAVVDYFKRINKNN